jgi:hypothetical protein
VFYRAENCGADPQHFETLTKDFEQLVENHNTHTGDEVIIVRDAAAAESTDGVTTWTTVERRQVFIYECVPFETSVTTRDELREALDREMKSPDWDRLFENTATVRDEMTTEQSA